MFNGREGTHLPLVLRAVGWAQERMSTPVGSMTGAQLTRFRERQNTVRTAPRNRWLLGTPHPDVHIADHTWSTGPGAVRVRIYTPLRGPRPPGLVVCLHGGGFVAGVPAQTDWHSSGVAALTPAVVVSVDYRLAPEDPFPAALDDSWAAVLAALDHAAALGDDPSRLAVMGDSAGGNIAAVVAARSRDHSIDLAKQVLIYPASDLTEDLLTYPSALENAHAPILSTAYVHDVAQLYAGDADRTQPELSPIRIADASGLAPALIQTAQYDPLRDQGRAYADLLRASGVEVTYSSYRTVHAFIGIPGIARPAKAARNEVVAELRRAFTDESAG